MSYWIGIGSSAKLAIASRPRGGDWLDDDLHALRREGVDILVSLLTPEEATELALKDEGAACARAGVEFLTSPFPIAMSRSPLKLFASSSVCCIRSAQRAGVSQHIAEQALEDRPFLLPHSSRLMDIQRKTPFISSRKREAYGFPTHRSRWNGFVNSESDFNIRVSKWNGFGFSTLPTDSTRLKPT